MISFNKELADKLTAKQFEKLFRQKGYEGDWKQAWRSIGGKITEKKEEA